MHYCQKKSLAEVCVLCDFNYIKRENKQILMLWLELHLLLISMIEYSTDYPSDFSPSDYNKEKKCCLKSE